MAKIPRAKCVENIAQSLLGFSAVFRHELRMLFFAPLSYLFQIAFLLGLSTCVFLVTDFYATDEATIRLLLVFIPWISLILIPSLAMSSWMDSQADRELELTFTLPVGLAAVVLGKFAAGYVLLLLTLGLTFPFVLTLGYLGDPDPGVIVSGYLACALLMGVCFSLALFAAAVVREPVGSFVTGVALLFFIMLCGWDVFGRLLRTTLPQWAWESLAAYSPVTWLSSLGAGVLYAQGLFYFLATIAISLVATLWIVRGHRAGGVRRQVTRRQMVMALALGVLWLLGIPLSSYVPGQVDLTAQSEFSLHAGTRTVLDRLPQGVRVTFYWSDSEDTVPVLIKSHARRIERLLSTMAASSHVKLVQVDPRPDTQEELQALSQGIHRVPMSSGDHFFLGLTVEHEDRVGHIAYLDIRRDSLLEYDIALALNGLTREQTPKIAVISPLLPSTSAMFEREGLSFMAELKRAYDVAVVPFFKTHLPDDLDAVLLIDADILHKDMLYEIDQYVMSGGSLIVMIDPYTRVKPANNVTNAQPSVDINDISDLLQRYGVTYQGKSVIGDANLASVVSDDQQGRLSYPFWLRVRESGLSSTHPATANLNEVLMVEPGALLLAASKGNTPLVVTTPKAGSYSLEGFDGKTPRKLALDFVAKGGERVLAAAIKAPFKSAFADAPDGFPNGLHLGTSDGASTVFIVADVDWLFDPFSLQKTQLEGETAVRPLNDNLAFLLNMVEYATGDQALMEIRSRGQLQRPFTRIAALFRNAQSRLKDEEADLTREIAELETKIGAVSKGLGDIEFEQLPENIKKQLREFEPKLLSARRNLRQIRAGIRAEVDSLTRNLTLFNLLCGPLIVLILAWAVFRRRRAQSLRFQTPI